MAASEGFYFLSNIQSRRVIRVITLFVYFVLFQSLILLQRPFLQFDFIVIFYLSFGFLFAHHLVSVFSMEVSFLKKGHLLSYVADFAILILFMKHFPYLSSFILVLQLFLLFIASFDLDFFELSILGFMSSLGVSLINLSASHTGSIQSVLSLTLFNLSYVSVIVVSRQLRSEFSLLQTDLSSTTKKWKSQEEFSKTLIEKIPLGLAVFQGNQQLVLENTFLQRQIQLLPQQIKEILSPIKGSVADINYGKKILNIDQTSYFDEDINEQLDIYLVRDVTEVRALEYAKKQNEKLAAVGTLAAGMAHEIRNPLAGISGSIQMLSQDTADETQKKLMAIVLKEIDRLNALISEFLDYAKPERAPDMPVNLKQVLEEVTFQTQRHPELAPEFKWNVELSDQTILGFSEKLKQAFLNIIINSIQAMKTAKAPLISVQLKAESANAVLRIKDNGSGMNEQTRQKMFEPFHTTKSKGTGLGLAITHKILELHKAQIEVQSEPGVGTEFVIRFPLTKGM